MTQVMPTGAIRPASAVNSKMTVANMTVILPLPPIKDAIPITANVPKVKKLKKEQCSCKVVNRENKFKAVSNPVWICLKAVIVEKTIKEE